MALWLVRHGETEWSLSGQHTSRTDLPLTEEGELQAVAIGKLLVGRQFDAVLSSPLQRAVNTAKLAGFGDRVQTTDALVEVDYGEYEGLTTKEIWERAPGWELFRDGSPGGETPEQVAERIDALLAHVDSLGTSVLLFGHGHCMRAIGARFLRMPVTFGAHLRLDPSSVSILSHERDGPAIVVWNRRVPPRAVVVADVILRANETAE
jgi:broad specificity phosphatase PhoE